MPKARGDWKICPKCGETKHISDFNKDKRTRDGLKCWCKTCRYTKLNKPSKYGIKRTDNEKEYMKEFHLVRSYGITLTEWYNILEKQSKVCAVCKNKFTKKLCVDHDHITGKIRGLLCDKCNRGLGHFNDSIQLLKNAINYLENN